MNMYIRIDVDYIDYCHIAAVIIVYKYGCIYV